MPAKCLVFLLATWPALQLFRLGSGAGMTLDLIRPIVLVLVCIVFLRAASRMTRIPGGMPIWTCLAYLLYLGIHMVLAGAGISRVAAVRDLINIFLVPLSVYVAIQEIGRDVPRRALVYALLGSGAFIALVGIAEGLVGHNLLGPTTTRDTYLDGGFYRTAGPFWEGIGYSATVLAYVPFMYYFQKENLIPGKVVVPLNALYALGTLVALSRATMIALAVFLIIRFTALKLRSVIRNVTIALVLCACLVLSWTTISSTNLYRNRIGDAENITGRYAQYMEALQAYSHEPLFGIGYERWKENHYYYIHSTFVRVLTELGTVGFVVFVFFVGSLVLRNFSAPLGARRADWMKVRLCYISLVVIVPATVDLLHNAKFMLCLLMLLGVLELDRATNSRDGRAEVAQTGGPVRRRGEFATRRSYRRSLGQRTTQQCGKTGATGKGSGLKTES